MTLTEAEKRQLLRERRAAKIKNGGTSRLNKITGDRTGLEEVENATETTPTPEPPIEQPNQGLSRRISGAFDVKHNITRNSTTTAEPKIEQSAPKEVNLDDEEEFEKELQKIQEFLHKEQQHDQHQHIGAPLLASHAGADGPLDGQFNPFGDQLSQLQALLNGDANPQDFESLLGGSANGGDSFKGLSPEEIEYNKSLKAYNKQQNALFKARFLLFKFIFITSLTVWSFFEYETIGGSLGSSEILDILPTGISFPFKILTVFEILTTFGVFFKLSRTLDDEYDYKLSSYLHYLQFIPDAFLSNLWKQRIRLSVKYLEIFQFIFFDISVLVIVTGFLSVLFK